MRLQKKVVFVCFLLKLIVVDTTHPQLIVTNNGPTILDSNITFFTELLLYDFKHELKYVLDDGILKSEHMVNFPHAIFSRSFPASVYEEGSYFMNITVLKDNFFISSIVVNRSSFHLQRDLIGAISAYSGDVDHGIAVDEIAVSKNVSIAVNLHDTVDFLKDAVVDYSWSIGYEKYTTLKNVLTYNFHDAGRKDIKAIVTAILPNNVFKYGAFEKILISKVPVNNINVSGNPFLYHGDYLNLDITCDGTPPFIYCFKIMKSNVSTENFTCEQVSTFTNCHMKIMRYMQHDGKYNVAIYISNNVHEIKRIMEVMVYSVTVNPTLSTIIIPIVCSLLTLIILAIGISYYIQQRNQMAVEVANFDFQEASETFTERTFFEHVFDSFMCRSCSFSFSPRSSPAEVEHLID